MAKKEVFDSTLEQINQLIFPPNRRMTRRWQKQKYDRISHIAAEKMTGIDACNAGACNHLTYVYYYIQFTFTFTHEPRAPPCGLMPDDRAFSDLQPFIAPDSHAWN